MLKFQKSYLLILVAFVFFSSISFSDEEKFKETYYANAIALGRGLSSNLQVTITRWTTDEERNALLKTLTEQGQEKMIDLLRDQKETGFLRLPNTMGYRLYYAYQTKKENKRRIVLCTDRPVSMPEAWRNGRSMDYLTTMVVLDLDENNTGEGILGFALELKVNPETRQLEIENYGTDPVQLKKVRKVN
ncbi:MAG TPA: hypothetical protein VLH08_15410 [Acidobacteriota bacterium]|nr:hypothetical protein [Acidobacteriota bacterium]